VVGGHSIIEAKKKGSFRVKKKKLVGYRLHWRLAGGLAGDLVANKIKLK
jgi:hypothetical protein